MILIHTNAWELLIWKQIVAISGLFSLLSDFYDSISIEYKSEDHNSCKWETVAIQDPQVRGKGHHPNKQEKRLKRSLSRKIVDVALNHEKE